jgi:queuine/archaeosine tRNA-ribosyltransferase
MRPSAIFLPVVNMENRFWEHYDHLLVTPFVTGFNIKRKDIDNVGLDIYADSGGYQMATLNKKVSALGVLRWQERIANVGFTLDVPPHTFRNFTPTLFNKCMKQSNKNAELMWQSKVNDDMELWGVLQGKNYDELNQWYIDLTKIHAYDGYSISLSINRYESVSILPWIQQLQFAKKLDKRTHFLGYSELLFSVVLAKIAKINNQVYTYDSSTATIGSRYAKYIDPFTFKNLSIGNLKSLQCYCPICTNHKIKEIVTTPKLIDIHNLYAKINFNKLANLLVKDDELFKFLISRIIDSRTYYKKYKNEIISNIMNLIYDKNESIVYDIENVKEKINQMVSGDLKILILKQFKINGGT